MRRVKRLNEIIIKVGKLDHIAKSMLSPLSCRAQISVRPHHFIYDKYAVKILEKFFPQDYKLIYAHPDTDMISYLAGRAYQFDILTRRFLKKHPSGTIVNLGAGIDTGFYRVDNGKLNWVDIDVPDVMQIREELFTKHRRVHSIAMSLLNPQWMHKIKNLPGPYLFFAGGVLMYFPVTKVRTIIKRLADNFPKTEFIFDVISKERLAKFKLKFKRLGIPIGLRWGINNYAVIRKWSSRISSIKTLSCYKNIKNSKAFSKEEKEKMRENDKTKQFRIVCLKFKAS